MGSLLRRIKAALGMGLTWAFGWGFVGFAIELAHNIWPNALGAMVDIWPAALAFPAFFGGILFSGVLGIAARNRRFDELSIPHFAGWGALGGLLLGLLPGGLLAVEALTVPQAAAVIGMVTILTTTSATGTLLLARMSEDRELAELDAEIAEVGLSGDEAHELLGD